MGSNPTRRHHAPSSLKLPPRLRELLHETPLPFAVGSGRRRNGAPSSLPIVHRKKIHLRHPGRHLAKQMLLGSMLLTVQKHTTTLQTVCSTPLLYADRPKKAYLGAATTSTNAEFVGLFCHFNQRKSSLRSKRIPPKVA